MKLAWRRLKWRRRTDITEKNRNRKKSKEDKNKLWREKKILVWPGGGGDGGEGCIGEQGRANKQLHRNNSIDNESLSTGCGSGREEGIEALVLQAGHREKINIRVRACGLSPLP